jgi:hypothetical protein
MGSLGQLRPGSVVAMLGVIWGTKDHMKVTSRKQVHL